jgi:hypothetical protein
VSDDYATLPYEAGWAHEAIFFTQVEGDHPQLTVSTEVSPDGIHWCRVGESATLVPEESMVMNRLSHFGNWVRLSITGATESETARILVHLNLKG